MIAEEIARLAAFRGETVDQFSKPIVRRVGQRYSLIEKPGGDCIFWDKAVGCTVYPRRGRSNARPGHSGPRISNRPRIGTGSSRSAPARGVALVQPRRDSSVGRPSPLMNARTDPSAHDPDVIRAAVLAIYADLDAEVALAALPSASSAAGVAVSRNTTTPFFSRPWS